MNLLTEPWMPVRKRDGSREWVAPDRLSDPGLLAFDADRADFNGALAQFAIGLLQTTTPMDSSIEWRQFFNEPPAAAELTDWFAPVANAFEFEGEGPRFMQDMTLKEGGGNTQGIAGLLIDSPGNNTREQNRDHFVKRGGVAAICDGCAALALFTIQINAPEGGGGGGGKFTGIRGGGPLTTVLTYNPKGALWQDLWLNVRERSVFLTLPGNAEMNSLTDIFPWTRSDLPPLGENRKLTPTEIHPAHVFWALPRRMWLNFSTTASGDCGICHRRADRLIVEFEDGTGGLDYESKGLWDHPLSPYREARERGFQPVHARESIGYRHWLPWVASTGISDRRRAKVVEWCFEARRRVLAGQLTLWAFGYDMDGAKPKCWYEATLPLYGLGECQPDAQRAVESEVANWLAGADLVAHYLRSAVKDAWFRSEAKGSFGAIDAAFWNRTESVFYDQLKQLIDAKRNAVDFEELSARESWLKHLVNTALALFDREFVGAGLIERQDPRRVATAFHQLKRNSYGSKIRLALGLPDDRVPGPRRRGSRQAATA